MNHSTSLKIRFLVVSVVAILSVVYAIPNLYGEDPSIQLSAKEGHRLSTFVLHKTKLSFQQAHLSGQLTQLDPSHALIRFQSVDDQLKAYDALHTLLPHYISKAMTLSPRTPHWLKSMGASPMKLGLDLRGGVHFLLQVDTHNSLKEKEKNDLLLIKKALRHHKIIYQTLHAQGAHVSIQFTSDQKIDAAKQVLSQSFPQYDIQKNGSSSLKLTFKPEAKQKLIDDMISQTIVTLNHRVNELGVSEAVIQRQGQHNIGVDLPGIQDPTRAKNLLGKTATLRFHLVNTEDSPQAAILHGPPNGSHVYRDQSGRPILLKDDAILTGNSITYAQATLRDGRPAVTIQLGGGKEAYFQKQTASHIGSPLAVVYVDTHLQNQPNQEAPQLIQHEKVINVATIQSALGHRFEVTGLGSYEKAKDLALLLRSGALAAPVQIIQELTIGPSMGQDNIDKGFLSLQIGLLSIFMFMLFYYRFFGIVANIALLLNVFLIVSLLAFIGATLTLPGIAGIVLTVGMAVDANVLVNERIREELRLGIAPMLALKMGYDRAFATIIDSNVTTLLVALVLFTLGSSTVKGFAITLMLGLIASMFTSVYVTRTLVEWWYGVVRSHPKKLSIGI